MFEKIKKNIYIFKHFSQFFYKKKNEKSPPGAVYGFEKQFCSVVEFFLWLISECWSFSCGCIQYKKYSTIQYDTMQYNTVQYNTIQYNTLQYNTIQCNTIQYNTIRYNAVQYSTIQYDTMQYNTNTNITIVALTP